MVEHCVYIAGVAGSSPALSTPLAIYSNIIHITRSIINANKISKILTLIISNEVLMRFLSTSEKKTFHFAKKISKKLTGGEIFGLVGDLGAGKTVFSKGLAQGLGIKRNLTSPTFVLLKIYRVAKHKKIKLFIHIDAYRIKSPRDLVAIGADEYFGLPDSVTVIEWADKVKKILPKTARLITITHKNGSRIIKF